MSCVTPAGATPLMAARSGSHRAGRKEKPYQDNRKKPKRAKFHRNHFCLCERKVIKGLQSENRAELFGI